MKTTRCGNMAMGEESDEPFAALTLKLITLAPFIDYDSCS
jgi:hypothetical protein